MEGEEGCIWVSDIPFVFSLGVVEVRELLTVPSAVLYLDNEDEGPMGIMLETRHCQPPHRTAAIEPLSTTTSWSSSSEKSP